MAKMTFCFYNNKITVITKEKDVILCYYAFTDKHFDRIAFCFRV